MPGCYFGTCVSPTNCKPNQPLKGGLIAADKAAFSLIINKHQMKVLFYYLLKNHWWSTQPLKQAMPVRIASWQIGCDWYPVIWPCTSLNSMFSIIVTVFILKDGRWFVCWRGQYQEKSGLDWSCRRHHGRRTIGDVWLRQSKNSCQLAVAVCQSLWHWWVLTSMQHNGWQLAVCLA